MNVSGIEKVLLITGKFPDVASDMDGGSIMVSHLIEALRDYCTLDVLFTRTYNANFKSIKGVRAVSFHTNIVRNSNKFMRRLANIEWNALEISKLMPIYDKVVIVHCSKAFGLENLSSELLNNIILFPMYLTTSYLRSNEIVPTEYTIRERIILLRVAKLITPSQSEKDDLINDYSVPENRIIIVPRAINSFIESKVRNRSKANKIIYIGSIKNQKRNDDAIVLLSKLKAMGLKSHLYLVGSNQDEDLFLHCLHLVSEFGLERDIDICGILSPKEIAKLLDEMDINISVSRWETFGRGVFEGLCAGLPTVAYSGINCFSEYVNVNKGISFVGDIEAMVATIYDLCTNASFYQSQSQKAIQNTQQFCIKQQNRILIKEILC